MLGHVPISVSRKLSPAVLDSHWGKKHIEASETRDRVLEAKLLNWSSQHLIQLTFR